MNEVISYTILFVAIATMLTTVILNIVSLKTHTFIQSFLGQYEISLDASDEETNMKKPEEVIVEEVAVEEVVVEAPTGESASSAVYNPKRLLQDLVNGAIFSVSVGLMCGAYLAMTSPRFFGMHFMSGSVFEQALAVTNGMTVITVGIAVTVHMVGYFAIKDKVTIGLKGRAAKLVSK